MDKPARDKTKELLDQMEERWGPATVTPSECDHPEFTGFTSFARLLAEEGNTEPYKYSVDLRVFCKQCREPMLFQGLPLGAGGRATMSVDQHEARLPILPLSTVKLLHTDIPKS